MEHQFIAPAELASPSVNHLPLQKRIELWANLVDSCEAFLLSDVDLLVGVERTRIEPILNALALHGCRPKKSPPIVEVGKHCFVQLLYTPAGEFYDVQFDLLLAESELRIEATLYAMATARAGLLISRSSRTS